MAWMADDNVRGVCAGPWSEIEQFQFEKGIIEHGWGNWRLLERRFIPTRSNHQIKSHAQKFRKHHPGECKLLENKHEARRIQLDAAAPPSPATAGIPKVVGTPKRKKATPARRKGSLSKSVTKANKTPTRILRRLPSNLTSSPLRSTPIKKLPTKYHDFYAVCPDAPTPSVATNVLADVTSGVGRVTFDDRAAAASSSAFFSPGGQVVMTPRRTSAPTVSGCQSVIFPRRTSAPSISTGWRALMSPSRPAALTLDCLAPEDELARLAASVVTPCPAHPNMKIDEFILEDDEESLNDAMALATKVCDDDVQNLDPLPLQLKADDGNLDMIADFLDPSWNMAMSGENAVTPREENVVSPIASSVISRNDTADPSIVSYDSASLVPDLGETFESGDPFFETVFHEICPGDTVRSATSEAFLDAIIPKVCPHPQQFLSLRSLLTSLPDFNNPKEYVLGEDGFSRTGVEQGALCRARIKTLLEGHLNKGWWREDAVFINTAGVVCGSKAASKKFPLECLIALTAVMLDVDHWHTPHETPLSAIAGAAAVKECQSSSDEDDILHISQLLSGLWERVIRSIGRDGGLWAKEEHDSSLMRMERCELIKQMVTRLGWISRHQGNLEFSPHVAMYAHV